MDEVWCDLDLQQLQAGLHPAPGLHDHDPFWSALADCAASFLAGDTACFGVADIDLSGSAASGNVVVDGMDTSGFFAENDDHHQLMPHQEQQPVYSSSSLSSRRSLSIDSGGSSSTFFQLDDAAPALAAATAAKTHFTSPHSHPAAPSTTTQDPFAGEDEAIMRAMMAVISSASPSSSESSSPPLSQDTTAAQPAVQPPRLISGASGASHVTVRSSSLGAVAPERTTSLSSAASGGRQQENNSSQVYHMMSERKRREKLNDSFHTLRSLLPPCSKKDKTTVLINAASFLKTLEAQVSELEEKNTKLERYVPREDGGAATAATHRRAKVHISRAASDEQQVTLMVMVMVECDIVDLVLHVLECLRWMSGVSVLSVDADTYSPQALLKARAHIKLQIMDGDCWNEALFHEAMTKAVHDATSPSLSSCAAPVPLVAAA
ncbi:hypothetical protein BAE44_0020830 [Dichanthelium oligosanthes]|uniref:BHLH domain-containing protein n=1 Tax=Dichanthelium oligosanthes TaxID=888268 RepID=A0A1E5UZ53_9POAL|nr:hypothetical protein BAE44_0020830 [Dichanthelium oligosanthes]